MFRRSGVQAFRYSDVQVFGVPDPKFGESVAAWIRLKQPAAEDEIREFCRERIAYGRRFAGLSSLPGLEAYAGNLARCPADGADRAKGAPTDGRHGVGFVDRAGRRWIRPRETAADREGAVSGVRVSPVGACAGAATVEGGGVRMGGSIRAEAWIGRSGAA